MATLGPVSVSPLAGNELFFRSLTGSEQMNGLFEYTVQVLAKVGTIKLPQVLGQNMTVAVPLSSGDIRYFNGYITRFSKIGALGSHYLYRAVLHPWLWFLGRTSDCRIFQNQTIPDIVRAVFDKYPSKAIDVHLGVGDYAPQPYLVQYRETDLNFVCRLLERAGIAFHFTHDNGSHKLVLTDSITGRTAIKDYKVINLRPVTESGDDERLTSWHVSQEVATGSYALKDFDYLKPKAPLLAQLAPAAKPEMTAMGETFDYPGQYTVLDDGKKIAGVRLQQEQAYYETIDAGGSVRGVGVGNIFSLAGSLADEGDRQFLIVKAHYEVHGHSLESSGDQGKEQSFHCSLTVIDAKHPFRPVRVTPTPIVQGPQTAIVIGRDKKDTSGGKDEICTDEFGRILVRFPWERHKDAKPADAGGIDSEEDKPICWLRVAQLWAGSGWGTVFIPRIGQEVMVEFLEGDPDRPIVTGRVYNNDNKPPYLDEGKITQSGVRTHSTPGGGPKNYNEIRFEDKKGSEELYVQAEKNHTVHVKADRSVSVGGNETTTVQGTRTTTVTKHDTVTLKDKHDLTVTDLVTETFNKGHKLFVYAADQSIEIGENKTEKVAKTYDLTTTLKYSLTQGGTNLTCEGNNVHLKAGGTILLEAPTSITLQVGGNSITLSASGIEITASQVSVAGGGSELTLTPAGFEAVAPIIKMNG
ncbi:MAG TPA: type VI secretion system tip protein TssI/VgrG [Polyangia bacterium]|nr:type VI secretion system tip protein TssI/VgrG [Polyangia bacterium]